MIRIKHLNMRHALYALLLVVTTLLGACHDELPTPIPQPIDTTAERTIVMYLPFSGFSYSLYDEFQKNIQDIESCIKQQHGLGKNRLFVVISESPMHTHLYQIKLQGTECVHDTLKTYNSTQLAMSSWITTMLNDIKYYSNTRKVAMLVGCHGEGWLPAKNISNAKTRWFGGMGYGINIPVFAKGLRDAGVNLEYLLFDDCYLSTVEVAYDLKDVTQTLIASTSEVMAVGMPYATVFKYLTTDQPDYYRLTTDYIDFYRAYSSPYATLGVINTQYIQPMADFMKRVNAIYTWNTANELQLQDLDGIHFVPTVYFDFGSYAQALFGSDITMYAQFQTLMSSLIIAKGYTGTIYNYPGHTTPVSQFSGITISDPSTNTGQQGYNVTTLKTQTAWWKATH